MDVAAYIDLIKSYQVNLLNFLESKSDFEDLTSFISKINFKDSIIFKSFLHVLVKIADNHHRPISFFQNIEQILNHIKKEILKNFTNNEIFDIFSSNKMLILYLINNKILNYNNLIYKRLQSYNFDKKKYIEFFYQESYPFITDSDKSHLDFSEIDLNDFDSLRTCGENPSSLCECIRDDNKFLLKSKNATISSSIYETNNFLIKKKNISISNYAAFHGSQSILKEIKNIDESIWTYAVHSNNIKILQFLEKKNIRPISYIECFKESIKCHHNEIAHYIKDTYMQNQNLNIPEIMKFSIKFYNFEFIEKEWINDELNFLNYVKYDHYYLVDYFLKTNSHLNLNQKFQHIIKYPMKDMNYTEKVEDSYLHFAVKKANIDIVQLLIENDRIDPNVMSKGNGKMSFYKNNQLNLEIVNETYKTALLDAVKNEHIEIVSLLIKSPKVDVNIPKKNKEIIEEPNNKEKNEEISALFEAIDTENIDIIKILLNNERINLNYINTISESNIKEFPRFGCEMPIPNYRENLIQEALFRCGSNEAIRVRGGLFSDTPTIPSFTMMKEEVILEQKITSFCKSIEKNNENIVSLLMINDKIDHQIPKRISIKKIESEDENEDSKHELENKVFCQTPLELARKTGNPKIIRIFNE